MSHKLWAPAIPSIVNQFAPACPNTLGCGVSTIWLPPISSKVRTPGAMVNRPCLLRAVAATSSTSFVSSVLPEVDATSTTGDAPDTVTVSATVASPSCTSILAVKPTVSRTSCRRAGRKPARSNATA